MLDIGWSELLVIGVVALVVIGPKELPTVLRKVGQGIGKLRRMAGDFQGQFNEALREAELSDLKDSVSGLRSDLSGLADNARSTLANAFPTNPLQDLDAEMKATSTPVERKDLPAGEIEALLPEPTELESNAFETIEDEVRAATAKLDTPSPAPAATSAAAPSASAAPATAASPAPAATSSAPASSEAPKARRSAASAPSEAAAPAKRAPRRKPAAETEVTQAVADLDATAPTAAESAAKPAAKPRVRAKAPASPSARSRAAKAPGGTTGNEGPGA
ncbi:Sec-independent protein translocase protein TatB [Ancylobacter radicis]|uniref:Sec-independent protein translocase protein TatB n=1 Tax=Ancylobacter radicis TaxID=2836179 RepID=A0ABS5R3B7_9HYPH|nr:Sec-independent protein translocase protein TatB [Ancylobacter radicis]MBS9476158.1 Sec-independent protein translocase protein TatB [Ancylobacter radicis]